MRHVNSEQCERSHRGNDRPNFRLHQSFNCFQGDRAGTCSGDGGSPLVCPIKNSDRYMQVSVIYLLCKPDHINKNETASKHFRLTVNIIDRLV